MSRRATTADLAQRIVIDYRWPGYSRCGDGHRQEQWPELIRTRTLGPDAEAAVADTSWPNDLHELRRMIAVHGFAFTGDAIQSKYLDGAWCPLWREVWALNPGRADVINCDATHLPGNRP